MKLNNNISIIYKSLNELEKVIIMDLKIGLRKKS